MADQQAKKRLVPHFYHHPDHGPVCETRTGPEAGADTIIERVSDEHARLHPEEYKRFVSTFGLKRTEGTSLRKIPGVDDTIVTLMAIKGIDTVEKLAALDDSAAAALMPNAQARAIEHRDVARILVKPTAPVDEVAALKAKLAAAERERDDALKLADEATRKSAHEPEDQPSQEKAPPPKPGTASGARGSSR